jgi:hypothetical protein
MLSSSKQNSECLSIWVLYKLISLAEERNLTALQPNMKKEKQKI